MTKVVSFFLLLFVFVGAWAIILQNKQIKREVISFEVEKKDIKVGGVAVKVVIADDETEHKKGLSGNTGLSSDEGMLFVFPKDTRTVFWMKDMLISLDIIWIDEGKVVQINKNVPFPSPGTSESKLTHYPSNQPIDYVLEVSAGFSDKNNIKVGTTVDLSGI